MKQRLVQITLVVKDYDEAIKFYTETLNFKIKEDTKLTEAKRWIVLTPPGFDGCGLLLGKAANDEQGSRIGNQTGGRVFLFLHTDDLKSDFERLKSKGVKIVRGPTIEEYGTVLVFEDLYGNLIDLIQHKE